jgi:hypothetical protein
MSLTPHHLLFQNTAIRSGPRSWIRLFARLYQAQQRLASSLPDLRNEDFHRRDIVRNGLSYSILSQTKIQIGMENGGTCKMAHLKI